MTEQESLDMAVKAVAIYAARHPRPLHVTITQAAEMLGRSRPTVRKLLLESKIRTNAAGSIPIEAIDRMLASRA
jgi:hypothetical protein